MVSPNPANLCRISPKLAQGYFFDVEPGSELDVVDELRSTGSSNDKVQTDYLASPWRFAVWLGGHSLLCLRMVDHTTGLDRFLITANSLSCVHGVSEFMALQFKDVADGPVAFDEIESALGETDGDYPVIATVFLQMNRSLFSLPSFADRLKEAVGEAHYPEALKLFDNFSGVSTLAAEIAKLSNGPFLSEKLGGRVRTSICAGIGDWDLVCICAAASTHDVDKWLYSVVEIGVDTVISSRLGLDCRGIPTNPVIGKSTTEVGIREDVFREVYQRASERSSTYDIWANGDGKRLIDRLSTSAVGAGLYLEQGVGGVAHLKDQLDDQLMLGWKSEALFGVADLRASKFPGASTTSNAQAFTASFPELIWQCACIDGWSAESPGRPQRTRCELSLSEPVGLEGTFTRSDLFGCQNKLCDFVPAKADRPRFRASASIASIDRFLDHAEVERRREDIRVVERIAERCVTLLKNPHIDRCTRTFLDSFLSRVDRLLSFVATLDELEVDIRSNFTSGAPSEMPSDIRQDMQRHTHAPMAGAPNLHLLGEWKTDLRALSILDFERVRAYNELIQAGSHLERALGQMTLGRVAGLLGPASEHSGPHHMACEVRLLEGVYWILESLASRFRVHLTEAANEVPLEELDPCCREIVTQLADLVTSRLPTVAYASHDPSFAILERTGIVRLPRWALWYPTRLSYLIHEYGHPLMVEANVGRYAGYLLALFLDNEQASEDYLGPNKFQSLSLDIDFSLGELDLEASRGAVAVLHEIVADLLCLSATHGLAEHAAIAGSSMEYLRTVSSRLPVSQRQLWMGRHFAAYTAARLLANATQYGSIETLMVDWDETSNEWSQAYASLLRQWERSLVGNGATQILLSQMGSLIEQFENGDCKNGFCTRRWFELGAVVALMCVFPSVPVDDVGIIKGAVVMRAAGAFMRTDDAAGTVPDIANSLWNGYVPWTTTELPERVIGQVEKLSVDKQGYDVPVQARLALSLYLSHCWKNPLEAIDMLEGGSHVYDE